MLKTLDDSGRNTWASKVKNMLYEHGFGYVWLAQEVGNIEQFVLTFKLRLRDCGWQRIHGFIDSSPKTLHYKHFKTMLNPERYLSMNMSYKHKKVLANFRTSGHSLEIEKGRHVGVERELRFCKYCLNRNACIVEDEFHFLLICPLYSNVRDVYLNHLISNRAITDHLFYSLLSSNEDGCIHNIAKYIFESCKLRDDFNKSYM